MILLNKKLFNVKNIESHKMMKQQNILEVMERCLILMLLNQIQQILTRLR